MNKRILTLAAAVLAAALFAGCGNTTTGTAATSSAPASDNALTSDFDMQIRLGAAGQKITSETKLWHVAFNQAVDHPEYSVLEQFGRDFNEATNRRYAIQIHPNSELGTQQEFLEKVQSGEIEMAIVGNPQPESVSDYFKVFDMPFLFSNVEQMMRFMETSPMISTLESECENANFKLVTYIPAGTRNMYTAHTPIHSVADMRGLTLRTQNSEVAIKMMESFNATAMPMDMSKIQESIDAGLIDGAENNEVTYVGSRHYEFAPYWSQTNHMIVPDWLILSTSAYQSLSAEDKAAFDRLAGEFAQNVYTMWNGNVDRLMGSLDPSVVTIVPADQIDVQSFMRAAAPGNAEIAAESTKVKQLYDAVIAWEANN